MLRLHETRGIPAYVFLLRRQPDQRVSLRPEVPVLLYGLPDVPEREKHMSIKLWPCCKHCHCDPQKNDHLIPCPRCAGGS